MTPDRKPKIDTNQEPDVSRYGVFGDFPTRAMFAILRATPRMPRFIEAGLLHFICFFIVILAGDQRRAVRKNLSVIWDDVSWMEGNYGAFRVFVNFGATCIDGIRTRLSQKVVTWEIDGLETFEQIRKLEGAAIILTTHTGNYDLAAALFSPKFGRNLHTVRAPEKSPYLQEIRRKELQVDTDRYQHFKVHYNSSDSLLGIELAHLLAEGELVAIQSDRVIAEVVAINVPVGKNGNFIRLPKGPLTLATITRCPCFPLHVVRTRNRHYKIIFQKPLNVSAQEPGARLREPDYARAWAASLMPFLEKYALEWFVFEEAFTQ